MLLTRKDGKPRGGFVRMSRAGLIKVSLASVSGELRPRDLALLLLLAEGASWEYGLVHSSIRALAEALKASPTTVFCSLGRLERLGVVRRPGRRRGRNATIAVSPEIATVGIPFLRDQHWRYWNRLVHCGDSEPPPPPPPSLVASRHADPLEATA
jgi:predicted transcriptional regulator